MRLLLLPALAAGLALCGPACQKHQPYPPLLPDPGGGGNVKGGGTSPDGSTEADGGCASSLLNDAPMILEQNLDLALPSPLGGTIATGTYFLTAANVYTSVGGTVGPTGRQFQETLFLDVSTFQDVLAVAEQADAGLSPNTSSNGTYTTAGTIFDAVSTCSQGTGITGNYSVSNAALRIYEGQNESVYTLQ